MPDVLRLIAQNHHVSENYECGINRHVVLLDRGDQLKCPRVVQIDIGPRLSSRNNEVNNSPDVLQAIDSIGHCVLCRISPKMGGNYEASPMPLGDDELSNFPRRPNVHLQRSDARLLHFFDKSWDLIC